MTNPNRGGAPNPRPPRTQANGSYGQVAQDGPQAPPADPVEAHANNLRHTLNGPRGGAHVPRGPQNGERGSRGRARGLGHVLAPGLNSPSDREGSEPRATGGRGRGGTGNGGGAPRGGGRGRGGFVGRGRGSPVVSAQVPAS
jgi:hypothetical protein